MNKSEYHTYLKTPNSAVFESISIRKEVLNKMRSFGSFGDTYSDVISKIMAKAEQYDNYCNDLNQIQTKVRSFL